MENSGIEPPVTIYNTSSTVSTSKLDLDSEPVLPSDHDSVVANEVNSLSTDDETQRAIHDTESPNSPPESTSPSATSASLLKETDSANIDIVSVDAGSKSDTAQSPVHEIDSHITSSKSTDCSNESISPNGSVENREVDDTNSLLNEQHSPASPPSNNSNITSEVTAIAEKKTQIDTSVSAIAPVKTDSVATAGAENMENTPPAKAVITETTSNVASGSAISDCCPKCQSKITSQSRWTESRTQTRTSEP